MNTAVATIAPVTSVGQVTLPKIWRDALEIVDRVKIEKKGDTLVIKKADDLREGLRKAQALITPEERARIKKYAGMTASEYREWFDNTPEGIKHRKEQYGE